MNESIESFLSREILRGVTTAATRTDVHPGGPGLSMHYCQPWTAVKVNNVMRTIVRYPYNPMTTGGFKKNQYA